MPIGMPVGMGPLTCLAGSSPPPQPGLTEGQLGGGGGGVTEG
jgi:hypothetical protein